MPPERRKNIGARNERDASDDAAGKTTTCERRGAKLLSFSRRNAYLMFRVRGEELQRADCEPELVRVRELPDAHAEGNQLVARDARRPFHDILADVIHALRV